MIRALLKFCFALTGPRAEGGRLEIRAACDAIAVSLRTNQFGDTRFLIVLMNMAGLWRNE